MGRGTIVGNGMGNYAWGVVWALVTVAASFLASRKT